MTLAYACSKRKSMILTWKMYQGADSNGKEVRDCHLSGKYVYRPESTPDRRRMFRFVEAAA